MKRCTHCKEFKDDAWFGHNKSSLDGMAQMCKPCFRAAAKKCYNKKMKNKKFRKSRAAKARRYRKMLKQKNQNPESPES